jgi:hypothetical protein
MGFDPLVFVLFAVFSCRELLVWFPAAAILRGVLDGAMTEPALGKGYRTTRQCL